MGMWEYVISALTQQEKHLLANREKDKGNDAFRAKDYEEAVAYYSRSAFFISSFISESILLFQMG